MAATEYGVNSAEAVKLWSKKLYREGLAKSWIGKFIGDSDSALIQRKNDLKKSAGDRVRVTLRMQLSGDGVQGDNTLEGNEEALTTYTDDIYIDQLRHAVRSKGKMTEQRIPFSIREEAKDGLVDWWANRWDTWFFNQMCGNVAQTDTRYTGNQAVIAPSTIQRPNAVANDQSLGTSDTFTLARIDAARTAAVTAAPIVRPIKVGGDDKYVCFLHPFQVRDLRTNTATGQWLDIQKAAMAGGQVKDNPIYTGALGEYNNVVLHEANRVTLGCNSSSGVAVASTRRAVFCGAQAAALAFGGDQAGVNDPAWHEELFDYGNQLGVAAGFIAGLKKTRFNSADFSTIVISTYAAA